MEKDPLSLETRRRIFQFIRERPGTYPRELERELDMQTGVVQYHLGLLESLRLVNSEGDGFRKRYYVSGEVSSEDRRVLSVLKLNTPRRIVIQLLQNPGSTFEQILSQFTFSKSALSFHLKKLTESGIVVVSKSASGTTYSVRDEDYVARVIITYRGTFLDNLVDSFIDSWLQI